MQTDDAPDVVPRWLALAVGALCCIVTHFLCVGATPVLWQGDGPHYLSLAEHLARGQGYTSSIFLFPDLMQPPLYPLLIALGIKLGAPPIGAASAVCLLGELATVVALLAIHRELWGARGRLLAAVVAGVHPMVGLGSGLVLEPLFLAAEAWAFLLALQAVRRESVLRAAACGALLGAAVLLRPEVVITAPMLGAMLLARGPWRWRAARVGALGAAMVVVVIPYGFWMRSHLGAFELFGKLRYNRPFAEIAQHLPEQADWNRRTLRTSRVQFALTLDHKEFLINRAFADSSFDPRPYFPRAGPNRRSAWRGAVVDAVSDGLRGFFHPVLLILAAIGVVRGWRRDRLVTATLIALVLLHCAPVVLAGDDYDERYLALPALFVLPLCGGGLAVSTARLRGATWAAAVVLAAGGMTTTLWRAQALAGGHASIERTRATTVAVERAIPSGARILGESPRYALLRDGWHFQLPCFEQREELADYVAAHALEWAILDARTMSASACAGTRALADPASWPAGWRTIESPLEGDRPVRIVQLTSRKN